ncbi:outer membrane protein assembly factor BamE precursor [mine drainage metagenome]|uniref:Outer membrane protein assembly factor BamE n=1 Tax=mine drainage metagenome TaxID=410659 RepID=A0A1J5SJZ5_9ZZZZ
MLPLFESQTEITAQMRIHIVLISMLLASCSNISSYFPTFALYKVEIRQGNLVTQDMRAKLKLGMTQSQVKAALGAPLISDPYHANRWDYFYSLEQMGKLVESQRLTLYFDKDVLSRIDDATPLKSAEPAKLEQNNG